MGIPSRCSWNGVVIFALATDWLPEHLNTSGQGFRHNFWHTSRCSQVKTQGQEKVQAVAQPPNAFLCTLRAKLLVLHCSGGLGCWLPGKVLSRRGGQCDLLLTARVVGSSWGAVTPNFLQFPESTEWGGGFRLTGKRLTTQSVNTDF